MLVSVHLYVFMLMFQILIHANGRQSNRKSVVEIDKSATTILCFADGTDELAWVYICMTNKTR